MYTESRLTSGVHTEMQNTTLVRPKVVRAKIALHISTEMLAAIDLLAERWGCNRSEAIRRLISKEIG